METGATNNRPLITRLLALSGAFMRNDPALLRHIDIPLWAIAVLTGLIGVYRHCLEIFGGCRWGYWWKFGSVSNTTCFAYLLVFLAVPLLAILSDRFDSHGLKTALTASLPLLFATFTIVPLCNSLFNYNFLRLPTEVYLPGALAFLYVPVGTFAGLAYIMVAGTRLFCALWEMPRWKAARNVGIVMLIFYAYTYVVGISLTWGPFFQIYHPPGTVSGLDRLLLQIQFYSSTFTSPIVLFLPVFLRPLARSRRERVTIGALVCAAVLFTLVFLNNAIGIIPALTF
jgi:hypothetical protein